MLWTLRPVSKEGECKTELWLRHSMLAPQYAGKFTQACQTALEADRVSFHYQSVKTILGNSIANIFSLSYVHIIIQTLRFFDRHLPVVSENYIMQYHYEYIYALS